MLNKLKENTGCINRPMDCVMWKGIKRVLKIDVKPIET